MIRVVIDTNIIVSALLQPLGPPAQVLALAISGLIELFITAKIYAEYEEVIRRAKFRREEQTIVTTLDTIRNRAHWVRPTEIVQSCSDPDDNIFLECADAARADYLVTGNQKHFPKFWKATKVITPREFMSLVAPHLIR